MILPTNPMSNFIFNVHYPISFKLIFLPFIYNYTSYTVFNLRILDVGPLRLRLYRIYYFFHFVKQEKVLGGLIGRIGWLCGHIGVVLLQNFLYKQRVMCRWTVFLHNCQAASPKIVSYFFNFSRKLCKSF